jgi:hypothetical protein
MRRQTVTGNIEPDLINVLQSPASFSTSPHNLRLSLVLLRLFLHDQSLVPGLNFLVDIPGEMFQDLSDDGFPTLVSLERFSDDRCTLHHSVISHLSLL